MSTQTATQEKATRTRAKVSDEAKAARRQNWENPSKTTLEKVIPGSREKDANGKTIEGSGKFFSIDLAPLFQCEDLAVLRSFAAVNVADVATALAVEAGDVSKASEYVSEALKYCAGVKGWGEKAERKQSAVSALKAAIAERDAQEKAILEKIKHAMAEGDTKAAEKGMKALMQLKAQSLV